MATTALLTTLTSWEMPEMSSMRLSTGSKDLPLQLAVMVIVYVRSLRQALMAMYTDAL